MAEKERFKGLRATGDLGGHIADALTIITANWQVVLALLLGGGAGFNNWVRGMAMTPAVYVSIGAFLAILWTIIGLTYLMDRRKPQTVQAHADYRYGLVVEGIMPRFFGMNDAIPSNRGTMTFPMPLKNFSFGPLKYTLESAVVQIETRTTKKYSSNSLSGFIPRGGGKDVTPMGFPEGSLTEFYGKGPIKGTADFSIVYGPPEGEPERRLKFSVEMMFVFPPDGNVLPMLGQVLGFSGNLTSEVDEPYK